MTREKRPLIISSKMDEIIKTVHAYRYVTAADITRLFFAPTSLSHVREILSNLAGNADHIPNHYLYRFRLPNADVGNKERIYTLGAKGRSYLKDLGFEVDWYFRPSDTATLSYQYLNHALALTRFLVAANLFVKNTEGVELPQWRTEYELRQEAGKILFEVKTRGGFEQISQVVVPDAWLDFRFPASKAVRRPVLLEIDRGSEQQKYFKRHIASRVAFVKPNSEYRRMFGTSFVTIAYATTANEVHLNHMLTWTEEILTELNQQDYADLFRFCSLGSGELDENQLFLAPSWRRPFDKKLVALLS